MNKNIFLVSLFIVSNIIAIELRNVKTVIYNVDDNNNNYEEVNYKDAFGKNVQTQIKLNGKVLLGARVYDYGKISKEILPFMLSQSDFGYLNSEANGQGWIDESNRYYLTKGVDYESYPFSEVEYTKSPLRRTSIVSKPGETYKINLDGHCKEKYEFYVTGKKLPVDLFDENGFVLNEKLQPTNYQNSLLTEIPTGLNLIEDSDKKFLLNVVKDENGNFQQMLLDPIGRVLRKKMGVSLTAEEGTSKYEYDGLNRIVKEILPEYKYGEDDQFTATNMSREINYDYEGRIKEEYTNQGGRTEYFYNADGSLDYYIDENMREMANENAAYFKIMIKFSYDIFYRLVKVSKVYWLNSDGTNVKEYDKIIYVYNENLNENLDLISKTNFKKFDFSNLTNVKGRLIADISFGENYEFNNDESDVTINVYSYTNNGKYYKKYIHIPDLSLQQFQYVYDLHDKIIIRDYTDGESSEKLKYTYNDVGKLKIISKYKNGQYVDVIEYYYDELGRLAQKKYLESSKAIDYNFNKHNRISSIDFNSSSPFKIEYYYDEDGVIKKQYNGFISGMDITYPNSQYGKISYEYQYDDMNRLSSVNSNINKFDCIFEYDNIGRIKRKKEGDVDLDEYQYSFNNKLLQLESVNPDIYEYDNNGNLVVDKSKSMIIYYDWRNKPVKFSFYSSVNNVNEHGALLSFVEISYNADGDRVQKKEYKIQQ